MRENRKRKRGETAIILSNRHRTSRSRKVDDRKIVIAVKKNPKISVTSQSPQGKREFISINCLKKTIMRLYRKMQSSKNQKVRLQFAKKYINEVQKFWNTFYRLMRPRLTSNKVLERPKCGKRRDLLMIQNIQVHLWSMVEEVLWLGLAWLLL